MWPYWAYTYSPDPFQPKALSDQQNWDAELSRCPGFPNDPDHYQCRPQPQGWSNCWKCPPKDPDGGGYTAYRAVSSTRRTLNGAVHGGVGVAVRDLVCCLGCDCLLVWGMEL